MTLLSHFIILGGKKTYRYLTDSDLHHDAEFRQWPAHTSVRLIEVKRQLAGFIGENNKGSSLLDGHIILYVVEIA